MEFYIIELPKYEKYKEKTKNKKLNRWIKFIKEPGGIEMEEDKAIQKAKEDAGYDKGLKVGLNQGRIEKKKEIIQIAKNLLKLNMSIEQIKEVTGLTEEKIKKLK